MYGIYQFIRSNRTKHVGPSSVTYSGGRFLLVTACKEIISGGKSIKLSLRCMVLLQKHIGGHGTRPCTAWGNYGI